MGTGQGMRREPQPLYRDGVRVIERTGKQLRDLVARQDQPSAGERTPIMNRPASVEGESRVIERTERERAVAANEPREKPPAEGLNKELGSDSN
jgi:hypothetical protein